MRKSELLSRSKPLLLNAEQVENLLENPYTVVCKPLKEQPDMELAYIWRGPHEGLWTYSPWEKEAFSKRRDNMKYWKPPFAARDTLYVREPFKRTSAVVYVWENGTPEPYSSGSGFMYRADGAMAWEDSFSIRNGEGETTDITADTAWNSPVAMPKAAARLFFEVESVRVGQIQELFGRDSVLFWSEKVKPCVVGECNWDANPYVYAAEIKRIEPAA